MRRLSDNGRLHTRSSDHVSADTLKLIHEAFARHGGVRGKVQRSFAFAAVMMAVASAPAGARNRVREVAREHRISPRDIGRALGLTMFEGAMLEAIGHELSARQALPIIAQIERFAAENPPQQQLVTAEDVSAGCGCMGCASTRPLYKSPLRITRTLRAGRTRLSRRRKLNAQLRFMLQPNSVASGDQSTT